MERSTPIVPLLQRLLVAFALCGLVVFGGMSSGATRFYTWPWVFYGELLLLAPLVLLALDLWRDPSARLTRPTVCALLATAAAIGLSGALSLRPRFSFEVALFLWGGLALAALVARRAAALGEAASPACALRVAGAILAVPVVSGAALWFRDLALYLPGHPWADWPLLLQAQRNPHPAGHWNYTGGLALLALPWLATLAWRERGWWRTLWFLLAGLATLVLLSAASRGAILGVLAALAVAVAALAGGKRFRRHHVLLLAAAVVATGALLVAVNPRVRASLVQRSGTWAPTEGDVQRLGMLQGGALLLRERPWTGHGAGMTPFVYPAVRARLVGGVETSFQLHNAPLQWAVDLGLIGVAAALLLGGIACTGSWRWWRRSASDPLRPYGLASACTLVGYGAMALTDYQLSVVAITAAVAFHLGLVLAGRSGGASSPAAFGRGRLAALACLGAAAAAALTLVPHWRARQLFWSAWWTCDASDTAAIVARFQAAAEIAPWNSHYRTHAGLLLADRATTLPSRGTARQELEKSLRLDPLQEPCEAALGWLWLPDDPAQAERHFRAALTLLPDRDTLHLGLAFAELAQQRREAAAHSLALECVVNPEFITSPLWQMEPLASLRPAVAAATDRLFAQAIAHPDLPAWRQPALRYAQAFVRWWQGGAAPDPAALAGASEEQRQIFAALAAETTAAPLVAVDLPPRLASLAAARAHPGAATSLLTLSATNADQARAGALARLARRPGAPFADLLRLPAPGRQGCLTLKIARGHFAIMQRNNDGLGYPDIFPRERDAFADVFAGALYPPRGQVPGPVLTELRIPDEGSKRPDAAATP